MQRREFISLVGGAVAWPTTAFAQQPTIPTIGVLMATAEDDPESKARFQAFLQGLHAAGWTEGRNMRVESRWIGGDPERARTYAPTNISTNSEPEIEKNGTFASPATALANSVLPVPGGPTSNTPFGMRPPSRP